MARRYHSAVARHSGCHHTKVKRLTIQMPRQTPSASDFTVVVKSSAVANNIASLPAGSMAAARAVSSASSSSRGALSAVGAIIRQSAAAKANIPTLPRAVVVKPKPDPRLKGIELASASFAVIGRDVFLGKYYKTGELQWLVTLTGVDTETTRGTAADVDGNVFITGTYDSNTITIKDTTNAVYTLTRQTAVTHSFVVMFNTLGVFQWSAKLSSTTAKDIAVDSKSNVYIVSAVGAGGAIYDKNNAIFSTLQAGYSIVKYNADGTGGWTWKVPDPYNDFEFPLTVDKDDNVIHLMRLYGNGAVSVKDRGLQTGINLTGSSIYTMKLNTSTGKVDWVSGIGTSGENGSNRALAADNGGNIYVAFHDRNGSVSVRNVGLSTGSLFSVTDSNPNYTDAYVVKYNNNGTPQWIVRIKQTSTSAILQNEVFSYGSIDCDSDGNVFIAGAFASSVIEFINGDGSTSSTTVTNAQSNSTYDVLLAKFNSAGILQWVARMGGSGNDSDAGVRVDQTTGGVYLAAYASGSGTITDGLGNTSSTNVSSKPIIMKFASNGALLWKAHESQSSWGAPRTAVDPYGNYYYGSHSQSGITIINTKM